MHKANLVTAEGQREGTSVLVLLTSTIYFILVAFTMNATAEETKIYQQDAIGNIQYHKPSYVVQKDGRIIETDTVGNKLYHKQQYKMKDGKIYQIDSLGNIQHHKQQAIINTD